jgi:predicted nucleic acid-binding protein
MILIDTDILSAMAKIARLSLLFPLFHPTRLHITPSVFGEVTYSFNLKRQYAADVFALIVADQLQLVYLTQEEARFRDTLPATLGAGERESIAIAHARDGIVLSNESRVAYCCRQHNVTCLRLPDILRALWVEGVISRQEVQDLIHDLQIKDRMQFKQATIEAILAD